MEHSISLKDIEATGYTTWQDFYFSVVSSEARNKDHTYKFIKIDNKEDTITLRLPQGILQSMVLEEGKILLHILALNLFPN